MKSKNTRESRREARAAPTVSTVSAGIDPQHVAAFQANIDPTEFRRIRRYLQDPTTGIDYLLHVRDRSMLAPLAAQLDQAISAGQPLEPILRPLWEAGVLKISARQPLPVHVAKAQLDAAGVSAKAGCNVIYLPPFYLAHTSGLLDQAQDRSAGRAPKSTEQSQRSPKPQRRQRDHQMSH